MMFDPVIAKQDVIDNIPTCLPAAGVPTQAPSPAPRCDDGEMNGDETAVDCGGPVCPGCDIGGECNLSRDCLSEHCDVRLLPRACVGAPTVAPSAAPTLSPTASPTKVPSAAPTLSPTGSPTKNPTRAPTLSPTLVLTFSPTASPTSASCDDGAMNGDEVAVDCGGPDCPGCNVGGVCLANRDCKSDHCDAGTCIAAPTMAPTDAPTATSSPTSSPTLRFTGAPSTPSPTKAPTPASVAPTTVPTMRFTGAPSSASPTKAPSPWPLTPSPSAGDGNPRPTPRPTPSPTRHPIAGDDDTAGGDECLDAIAALSSGMPAVPEVPGVRVGVGVCASTFASVESACDTDCQSAIDSVTSKCTVSAVPSDQTALIGLLLSLPSLTTTCTIPPLPPIAAACQPARAVVMEGMGMAGQDEGSIPTGECSQLGGDDPDAECPASCQMAIDAIFDTCRQDDRRLVDEAALTCNTGVQVRPLSCLIRCEPRAIRFPIILFSLRSWCAHTMCLF